MSTTQSRRSSTESNASLWEKLYERFPQTQQDAPFANVDKSDSFEQCLSNDNVQDYEIDSDTPSPTITTTTTSPLIIDKEYKPWENSTSQDHLILIINNNESVDQTKYSLKKNLAKQGLQWTDEEEELKSWHFGLTAIHLKFIKPQLINIQILASSSSIPFWIKLKTSKQNNISKTFIPQKFTLDFDISLRYGALTDLNQFYYSPQHSWKNTKDARENQDLIWLLFLSNHRNGGGEIDWVLQNSKMRQKKQLLVSNINQSIIINTSEDGFDMYICQKCNMNEFEANAKCNSDNNNRPNYTHSNSSENKNTYRRRSSPNNNFGQRPPRRRSASKSQMPPLLCPENNKSRQPRRVFYEYYHRVGYHAGCFFPTVQLSLHINPFGPTSNDQRSLQNRIKQTLSLLIEYFLAHQLSVCYANIDSKQGPLPYLFFQETLPPFPSLIMKYSWQMLSIVGYRLQIQMDQQFLQDLFELHMNEQNPDELFYRVCVYLSRIFSLKPFIDINQELQHAISESKRKRDHSAYGLVRNIDIEEQNQAYVPSVTITPTTIRIKPLKLCRTNRVLRAIEQFGKTVEHFILVDIRDENGRHLLSYHFRDLRTLLLQYLVDGFPLMDDRRQYKYLHHSQSQLRERQFWFYHHDKEQGNLSFNEAYEWMGHFDDEHNPAKYAARMALCFSTTKATVQVPTNNVRRIDDIKTRDGRLVFTDGCGLMSKKLRNDIKICLGIRNDFSAVQFRYDGAKGVVSLHPDMPQNIHLSIRQSMKKFQSDHTCFEVCKVSAPRPLYLNRQAILLLSYRKISDVSFLILQQQNHLSLIHALLRNDHAQKLILQKIPSWFLPKDIHHANIDFIHEPFFRQLLISSCLQSTKELLQRTRIKIPPNKGRNMIGVVDEYNVLKPDQVYIQYTKLNEDIDNDNEEKKTKILDNCQVVITKNPCHHPGDIRTFTAVNYPQLKHLKDVVVFSQQGDRPAPHDISGSDLDGDEYLVIWHEYLVPTTTENTKPYDYDAHAPQPPYEPTIERKHINETILNIAEEDYLGQLSNLHLAFADKFGVDNETTPAEDVLSTVELAAAISQEVDSGKTGYHPLNKSRIKKLNDALENQRPDYMDNANFESYRSEHILGKLYRSSKRTLPGWNQLLRGHRHLRHLEDDTTRPILDTSLLDSVDRQHPAYGECAEFANQLAFVYRQEMYEILNLYGLSHESDLWCRNSTSGPTGELEDTAYTELEQLVTRTRTRFYTEQVSGCETGKCDQDIPVSKLCVTCRKRQQSIAVACYHICYNEVHSLEQAPILSLPWLFAVSLLQNRVNQNSSVPETEGLLGTVIKEAIDRLVFEKHRLTLNGTTLTFQSSRDSLIAEATVDITVCIFIEVLQQYFKSKEYSHWSVVLNQFIQTAQSFTWLSPNQPESSNTWELILEPHDINADDMYAGLLVSIDWTETTNNSIHDYFQAVLNICFEQGRQTNELDFLNISEDILLLLQKIAINKTI